MEEQTDLTIAWRYRQYLDNTAQTGHSLGPGTLSLSPFAPTPSLSLPRGSLGGDDVFSSSHTQTTFASFGSHAAAGVGAQPPSRPGVAAAGAGTVLHLVALLLPSDSVRNCVFLCYCSCSHRRRFFFATSWCGALSQLRFESTR